MPKITAARIALTALIVLSLTGCAGTVDAAPSEPQDATQAAPSETTTPLVAEKSSTATADAAELEAAYLVEVRDRLSKIHTQIPNATDEQLIATAYEACDRIAEGTSGEDMTLIEGETRTNGYYMDTAAISTSAALTICPRS